MLDCIESNSPRPGEGVRPVPHVVLVDAAHADTLTQDVRSLAWMVTKRLDSHKMVGNGIILFLQWEVLHVLGSVGDADEIEVGKLFRALSGLGLEQEGRASAGNMDLGEF